MFTILKKISPFSSKSSRKEIVEKSQLDAFNLEDIKFSAKKTTHTKMGECSFDICGFYCGICEDKCGC